MQAWLILLLAVVFEVLGTSCLKASAGLTRPWLIVGVVGFYTASFIGLALALKSLDVSVAYAVWAGLGTVLIAIIGVTVFGDAVTPPRVLFISLIAIGVIGLNLLHN